jgi:cell division protein FtsA
MNTPLKPNALASVSNDRPTIVGLDIGTTKVVAVAGTLNEQGEIDLLGVGMAESLGVNRGAIDNLDKTVDAIRQAIGQCADQANLEIDEVVVSIGGEHIRSRQDHSMVSSSNPDGELTQYDLERVAQEMRKVSLPSGVEILHMVPQFYHVDETQNVKEPIGMPGVRLQGFYHLVTVPTNVKRNLLRCVEMAGLKVADLVLQPLASAAATLTEEEKENGVCLVDIGGGTTDVLIYEDGILRHTAVIPLGGKVATNDIRQGCSVMVKHAEFLKVNYGSALEREIKDDEMLVFKPLKDRPQRSILRSTLARIIQARMEEIFELVLKEIETAGMGSRLSAGIVVTGGGARLDHLPELVEYVTGIDCRVGTPVEHIRRGMVQEASHPRFATATGLVHYGFQQLNAPKQRALPPLPRNSFLPATPVAPAPAPAQQQPAPVTTSQQAANSFTNRTKRVLSGLMDLGKLD